MDASAKRLEVAFRIAEASGAALVDEMGALAALADHEVAAMDFKLLYDSERRLFHIGYNATIDQVDANYYDLLASEARLASYVAIVKRDVPQSHWYALGRPLTKVAGSTALLSWGGTMFEYLMPGLLMRSRGAPCSLEPACSRSRRRSPTGGGLASRGASPSRLTAASTLIRPTNIVPSGCRDSA